MTDQAIQELYAAFAAVPKPKKIDGCRCCIDDKEVWTLLSKPLRSLSVNELSSYADSALLTVGSPEDYRYFLPRILEFHARVPGWWPDIEVIGRRMTLAGWQQWPEAERTALAVFFRVRIETLMAENKTGDLDAILCGAALAGLPPAPLLDLIASSSDTVLALYTHNADALLRRTLANAFWEDDPAAAQPIVDWFFSDEITTAILVTYGVDLPAAAKAP